MDVSAVRRDCRLDHTPPGDHRFVRSARTPRRGVLVGVSLLLWGGGSGGALLGCSGDTTGTTAPLPPAQTYWSLQLNYHAINLAVAPPYNTVQLSATPLNAIGAPLVGIDGVVRYSDPDSNVTVSASGLLTARYTTGLTQIVASLTVHGVTLTDTAFVRVTATAPPAPLATFSIQPRPDGLDSAKYALKGGSAPNIPVYATIATGDPATDTVCNVNGCGINGVNLLVFYRSSDPNVATIDRRNGQTLTVNVGHVTFSASTLAYGMAKQDTLPFVIGYPVNNLNNVYITEPRPGLFGTYPSRLTVGVGAFVAFNTLYTTPVAIVFPDSAGMTNANTGTPSGSDPRLTNDNTNFDVADQGQGQFYWSFSTAGTYTYRIMPGGATGTIIVSSGP